MHREPRGGREGQHRHDVVVHAVLDRSSPEPARAAPPLPSSPRDPWPRTRARIPRARPCRCSPGRRRGWRLRRRGPPPAPGSPASRCASPRSTSAVSRQGLHAGSSSTANSSLGHHLLRAGRAHDGPQHRPGGVERRAAVQRDLVERGGIDDRRPAFALRRPPGQDGDPSRQDGERRVGLDAGLLERGEPPLHRRHLSGAVGGKHQRGHQLHGSVPLRRVQEVLQRQRGGAVRLVPVGGAQVQLRDDVGLAPVQLAEQELSEQGVVAIPLAPTVERDHEQVRGLQAPKLRVPAALLEERIAERGTELIQHRRTPQEALNVLGQLHERLAVEVVGDVPVVPGDRAAPCPRSRSRSARRGTGPRANPRCARSPLPPSAG